MLRNQSEGLGEPSLRKVGDEVADSDLEALLVRNGIQSVSESMDDHVPLVLNSTQVLARRDVHGEFISLPVRRSVFLDARAVSARCWLCNPYGQAHGKLLT